MSTQSRDAQAQDAQAHDVVIRRAVESDAEVLHALVLALARALGETHRVHVTVADLERDGFGENPAFHGLIAEAGTRPAGMCLFHPYYASWRGRRGIFISDLYVEPQWRRSGLGRRLIAAAAAVGRDLDGTGLSLITGRSNHRARAFYDALGLEAAEDDLHYYMPEAGFYSLLRESLPDHPSSSVSAAAMYRSASSA